MTTLKIATIQFEPTQFDHHGNLQRLESLVREAALAGARLIVTPEMATTGYCWASREEVSPYVEPVPGPTVERFAEVAREHQCYVVIGMPEVDPVDELYYNSAVLIGPDGVVGVHRKSHPYISEPRWAAAGDGHSVFDTPIGRIALLICMDIHFIETARLAGVAGAEVICHLSNWLAERTPAPYWINRAYENGCYLIESNRWGLERGVQFSGGSCVIDPEGNIQAMLDSGDGIVLADLDLQLARQTQAERLALRRPEQYKLLAMHSYAWNPLAFFGLYGLQSLPPGKASRIAVCRPRVDNDVNGNLVALEALARQAREESAELLVCPELALTGPGASRALSVDSAPVKALMRLAAQLRLHLVVGFAEQAREGCYNSALLLGPEGVVGVYRKQHLSSADRTWAREGDSWACFDLPFGRLGLLIGEDCLVPEAARVLALQGCDLIGCPALLASPSAGSHLGTDVRHPGAIPTGADLYHWHLARVRAGENNLYLAFANGGSGLPSGVFGPDTFAFPRQERLLTDEEGVVVAPVSTANLASDYPTSTVRAKDLVRMRLPQHYRPLLAANQVAPGGESTR
ncbi:nitrilase-related carbon-nitrogen hydrolase [Pseudomonas oryzihabitans]|uniref:nitrilase-related carbon-nitrogen hydrolase n=1 Tax=Pseudomonas oryzihabitans TaxID=47885 RepID=UPI0028967B07|nr:nitrilase-related carbon-nitrogen hydrolase [Pseudomonas oryzihabitans]